MRSVDGALSVAEVVELSLPLLLLLLFAAIVSVSLEVAAAAVGDVPVVESGSLEFSSTR